MIYLFNQLFMSAIWIMRHGESTYQPLDEDLRWAYHKENNKEWTIATLGDFQNLVDWIDDLEPWEKELIDQNIEALLRQYKLDNKKIVIRSSPFARTLQTSAYIIDALVKRGIEVNKISIVDHIWEVKNFERPILKACVDGGSVVIDWKERFLIKEKTNPDNLTISEYFFEWWYRAISKKYLDRMWITGEIYKIETYNEVTKRATRDLSRAMKSIPDNTFLMIVSHQAWTDHLILNQEKYENWWQKPAEILLYKDDWTYERIDTRVS